MTIGKATQQEARLNDAHALRGYLTSLVYLRQEAKRDGLEVVAEIMWNALASIEEWLGTGRAPESSVGVLDSSLCHALDFLFQWMALPPTRQRQVAKHIGQLDNPTTRAAPKLRRRPSKTITH